MIRFKGIHHPALITGDLDRTIRFWRDLLGLRLTYTTGKPGDRQAFFSLDGQKTFVAFFEWPGAQPIPYRRHGEPRIGPGVFDHLAIQVESAEDLWELMARLEVAQVPVSDVADHGFCHSLYTYDPNGIPIEFLYAVPGVDLAAKPVFAGEDPSPVMRQGADPVHGCWPEPELIPPEDREMVPGAGREDFQ